MVKKTEIIFDLWRMGLLRKLNTVHIIFIVPIILRNSLADPRMNIAGCFCNTTSPVSGAILALNFVSAMDNLSSLTNQNGFGTTVVGEDPNAVYGLAQCFKDLNSVDCSLCFLKIRSQLPTCYPDTGGRIFLDGCFGRYENFSFFNQATDSMDSKVCSFEKNSSQPEIFGKAVEKVVTNVSLQAQRNEGFAVGSASVSNSTVYALVQCWENLNNSLCNSCINAAASSIFSCTPATEGRVLNAGCYMKYSTEIFWNLNQTVSHSSGKHKKLGIILGLSLGGLVFLLAFGIVIWRTVRLNKLNGRSVRDLSESELSASIARSKLNFRYKELQKATKNFDSSNKLGQGSHGTVFKGILSDGREVAIKRLFLNARQWTNQFFNEVNLINQVHHKNLVKFLGCSVDGPECLLVYEYYFNKSLDQFIFDAGRAKYLDWQKRLHIIQGVAEGLSYLHEESEIQIIHRDIKASNILLDEKFRPKITDFGLARSFAEDQTHLSTGIAGTLGYMAPEYVVHGLLTEKVDVYSFGVLILEVVTGERCSGLGTQAGPCFLAKIWSHYKANAMEGLIDPSIYDESLKDEILHVVCVGLLCIQATPKHRPKMSNVVALLRGSKRSQQHILPSDPPPFLDVLAIERIEEGNCSSVSDIYQR